MPCRIIFFSTASVDDRASGQVLTGITSVAQTLVFRGRPLVEHDTVHSLGLHSGALLHLVKCKVQGVGVGGAAFSPRTP